MQNVAPVAGPNVHNPTAAWQFPQTVTAQNWLPGYNANVVWQDTSSSATYSSAATALSGTGGGGGQGARHP